MKWFRIVFLGLLVTVLTSQKEKFEKFEEKKWKNVTEDLKYDPLEKKEEKQEKNEPINKPKFKLPTFSSGFSQAFFYVIIIGVLLIVIVIVTKNMGPSNKEVDRKILYKKLQEEHIKEMNLEDYLKKALELKDFRLAIRIKYLMLLKVLNEKKYIHWSKEKTNGEYLNELASQKNYYDFKKITLSFEIAWYGEQEVNEEGYRDMEVEFEKINSVINNG